MLAWCSAQQLGIDSGRLLTAPQSTLPTTHGVPKVLEVASQLMPINFGNQLALRAVNS